MRASLLNVYLVKLLLVLYAVAFQTFMICFFYSLKVCQGSYDSALIKAWEDWDENNGSENDHPKEFTEKQVTYCLYA